MAKTKGSLRLGANDDGTPIEVESGQTVYLPRYLAHFVIPHGWSGSGYDNELELTNTNGLTLHLTGSAAHSWDVVKGRYRDTMNVRGDVWREEGNAEFNDDEKIAVGRFDPGEGGTGVSLTRLGRHGSTLEISGVAEGSDAARELEGVMQSVAASAVFQESPWKKRLDGFHLSNVEYLGGTSIRTRISVCGDGWAEEVGNVTTSTDIENGPDGPYDPNDPVTVTSEFDSDAWGKWTAHGDLDDGMLAIQFANGRLGESRISLVELLESEEVRVGGVSWSQWHEPCSAPEDAAREYEELWEDTLDAGGPNGFEERGQEGSPTDGQCACENYEACSCAAADVCAWARDDVCDASGCQPYPGTFDDGVDCGE